MVLITESTDKSLFDRIAVNYSKKDTYPSTSIVRKSQIIEVYNAVVKLKKDIHTILELGCGVGATCKYLDGKYKTYYGIDYSEKLIEIAKHTHRSSNIHFIAGNIKEYVKPESINFDLIIGIGVLHHIVDLKEAISVLYKLGSKSTMYCFIEPYGGNPLIQFMRFIRKIIDKNYSSEQITFNRHTLSELFSNNGFSIHKMANTGYLSTPFSQVILKPKFIFYPISKISIYLDSIIHKITSNTFLSWNLYIIVKHAE
jgi:ubiquinone/menaquinone biosynthesis C-methylase UbiE